MNNFIDDIKMKNLNKTTNDFFKKIKKFTDVELIEYINEASNNNVNLLMTFTNEEECFFMHEKYAKFIIKLIKEDKINVIDAFINNGLNPFDDFNNVEKIKINREGFYYKYIRRLKCDQEEAVKYENFLIKTVEHNINEENVAKMSSLLNDYNEKNNINIDIKTNRNFMKIPVIKKNALYYKNLMQYRDIEEIGILLREEKKDVIKFEKNKESIYERIYSFINSHVFTSKSNIKKELLKIVDNMSEFNNEVLSANCHLIHFTYDSFMENILNNEFLSGEIKINIEKNRKRDPLSHLLVKISGQENKEKYYHILNNSGFKPSQEEIKQVLFNSKDPEKSLDITDFFYEKNEAEKIRYLVIQSFISEHLKSSKKDNFINLNLNQIFENINYHFNKEQCSNILNVIYKNISNHERRDNPLFVKQFDVFSMNIIKKTDENIFLEIMNSDKDFKIILMKVILENKEINEIFLNKFFDLSIENKKQYNDRLLLSFYNLNPYTYHNYKFDDSQYLMKNINNFFKFEFYKSEDEGEIFKNILLFIKNISKKNLFSKNIKEDFINYIISHPLNLSKNFLENANAHNPELKSMIEKLIMQRDLRISTENKINNKKRL